MTHAFNRAVSFFVKKYVAKLPLLIIAWTATYWIILDPSITLFHERLWRRKISIRKKTKRFETMRKLWCTLFVILLLNGEVSTAKQDLGWIE